MYNHNKIEEYWQKYWEENKIYKFDINAKKKKFYILDMFPYPSGSGLHLGHIFGYSATDVISRFKKYCGFNVLHPMGWDAFGLPAEQFAINNNKHPREFNKTNINNFIRELKSMGFDYDWDREIDTSDPKFYEWTQWIFIKLFEHNLAEYKNIDVNWCEKLGTVLANDELIEKDGKMVSERGEFPVIKKPMKQWILKITNYADRLISDLDIVAWSEKFKIAQKNWIGKSSGAIIKFKTENNVPFEIFTTRPDTIYGTTFLVFAPENILLKKIVTKENEEQIKKYIFETSNKSEQQRCLFDKSGIFTGTYAINPITNKKIPIYVADYVLNNYATGIVMGVPAHDLRDWEFAKKHNINIEFVIKTNNPNECFEEDGIHINSPLINGLKNNEAIKKISTYLFENKLGREHVTYKLRDWLFSRQRYWGEPIPIVFDENETPHVVKKLPVILPELKDFTPSGDGKPPLAKIKDWVNIQIDKKKYHREVNTMPGSAGSSWYFIAYLLKENDGSYIPLNSEKAKKIINKWMPVDLYVGGAEHAVGHLLYARFWHKFLYDIKITSTSEPFYKLPNRGIVLGSDGRKMSKSLGNVVNPIEKINIFGADALRLGILFMSPLDGTFPWKEETIVAARKFLERVYNIFNNNKIKITDSKVNSEFEFAYNTFIKNVTNNMENLKFNVAISDMMIFINECYKVKSLNKKYIYNFLIILSCFAPHICEEINFNILKNKTSINFSKWPKFSEEKIKVKYINIPVQENGKLRCIIKIATDTSEKDAIDLAKNDPKINKLINDRKPKRIIYIKNKIINFIF